MYSSPLHERLQTAIGTRTYREVGELTGTPAETVRRYAQHASPSVEFVTALCRALALNPDWLLTGRGPMLARHQGRHALKDASLPDLLNEAGRRVQDVEERLSRIEQYAASLALRIAEAERAVASTSRAESPTTDPDRAITAPTGAHAADRIGCMVEKGLQDVTDSTAARSLHAA